MARKKAEQRVLERKIQIVERFLFYTGAALLGVYVLARVHSIVMSQIALHEFSEVQKQELARSKSPATPQGTKHNVDFSLWSANRIAAYKKALFKQFSPPQAVLEIPKINLKVPVFDGTDDLTLNRGVGWIAGTARPGQEGNVGIAGHRDGFFRGLKDVVVGDKIELETKGGKQIYRVDQVRIVKPNNVQVLKDTGVPMLTLVTCYPFYFVGHAPQRYVVRASLAEENLNGRPSAQSDSRAGKN